jgi:hypothetical protein
MPLTLYHRTSIGEARSIMQKGFEDLDWDFGLTDAQTGEDAIVTGTWLADRPVGREEGIEGDALLEVTVDTTEADLAPFALDGMLWDANLWVVPADWVNPKANARILEVDPRSSWFHKAADIDDLTEDG